MLIFSTFSSTIPTSIWTKKIDLGFIKRWYFKSILPYSYSCTSLSVSKDILDVSLSKVISLIKSGVLFLICVLNTTTSSFPSLKCIPLEYNVLHVIVVVLVFLSFNLLAMSRPPRSSRIWSLPSESLSLTIRFSPNLYTISQ